jgi:hypothetical protein
MPGDDTSSGIGWTAEADGSAGVKTSTLIRLAFNSPVEDLKAGDISVENKSGEAVRGALSGGGADWSLTLDAVLSAGDLELAINRAGIESGKKRVAVYMAPAAIGWSAAANGRPGTVTSTAITVTFDRGLGTLDAGAISVADKTGGVVAGDLSGGGATWTLALNEVISAGDVEIAINQEGVASGVHRVAVYKQGEVVDLSYTALADGEADTETSTAIIFEFSGVVEGLTLDDISVENGTGQVIPGDFSGSGQVWTLALDLVSVQGTITVSVNRAGIDQAPVSVEVYKEDDGSEEDTGEAEGFTGLLIIKATAHNSSGLVVGSAGGSGGDRSRALSAPNGKTTVYIVAQKIDKQTLIIGGKDAAKVSKASGPTDGDTPGPRRDVLVVDGSSVADTGGSLVFVLTARESGRLDVNYTLTLSFATLDSIAVGFKSPAKLTYQVGDAFDSGSVGVTGIYSDGEKREETVYEVEGFDTSAAGTITVRFKKNGKYATGSSTSYKMIVLPRTEARLVFPYGGRIDDGEPQRGRYTVTQGHTLVIAPVLWRIPAGATYQWTVSGTSSYTSNGEFLTINPGVPVGNYNVTVTAYDGGAPIATTSTTVECVTPGGPPSEDLTRTNGGVAPGQNVEPNWGTSLGGFGGSGMPTLTYRINNVAGDDFSINGNAFGGWVEPGIIWVMKDENNNHEADDTWYELKGNAEALGFTVRRRYAVTYYRNGSWVDNLGNSGNCGSLQKYPSWYPDSVTLAGTLIDRSAFPMSAGDALRGYVDVLDNLYNIDDAVQADGTPVYLDCVDFVRVQTGEHVYSNVFGETSTEYKGGVSGAWDGKPSLTGTANGGGYDYKIVNDSGYDITVLFKESGVAQQVVTAKTSVSVSSATATLTFNYMGGNVDYTISGNTVTFRNGKG